MPTKSEAAASIDRFSATIGFEPKLWLMADKLRNNMDAADWTATCIRQGELEGLHQFCTSSCVVGWLVEMLAPFEGRIYDPACGSGGSYANFAWVQHFIHHFAPQGRAGFVLPNCSMSSNQSGEGEIRRALIKVDLADCMVALPGQRGKTLKRPWFPSTNFESFPAKRNRLSKVAPLLTSLN